MSYNDVKNLIIVAKIKITKEALLLMSKDLDLDETVLKNLIQVQDSLMAKIKGEIKEAQKTALAANEEKIKVLSEAKAKLTEEYDAEISMYKALVKELKAQSQKGQVEKKASKPAK